MRNLLSVGVAPYAQISTSNATLICNKLHENFARITWALGYSTVKEGRVKNLLSSKVEWVQSNHSIPGMHLCH